MNELQVFNNEEFGEVRTLIIGDEVYFVGKDVAEVLGYINPSKAIADHVDEEDKLNNDSLSSLGQRGGWLINESGLFSLILSSKLPSAKKFKRWVTSEVLPTLRRTGSYSMPKSYADVLRRWADEVEEKEKFILENKALQPKAKFYDAVTDSKMATPMDQVAKILAIPNVDRNKMFEILRDKQILQGNNVPYQKYIDSGYFRVIETKFTKSNGDTCINIKTLGYQKVIDYIRRILNKENASACNQFCE